MLLSRLIDDMVALTVDWNAFVPVVVPDFEDDDEPVAFVAWLKNVESTVVLIVDACPVVIFCASER